MALTVPAPTPYIVGKLVAVAVVTGTGSSAVTKYAYASKGSCSRTAKSITKTNARSGGYQEVRAGVKSATGSVDCAYNGSDPPVGIVEGANVVLIIDTVGYAPATGSGGGDVTAGRVITMPVMIEKVDDNWQADDDYGWTFSYQSNGAYTVAENSSPGAALASNVPDATPPSTGSGS